MSRTKKNLAYLLAIFMILSGCKENSKESKKDSQRVATPSVTRLAVFGHTYRMLEHPGVFDSLLLDIQKAQPDRIFLLGDIVRFNRPDEWETVVSKLNATGIPWVIAPGNHDLSYAFQMQDSLAPKTEKLAKAQFRQYANELNTHIEDTFAHYILINSWSKIDSVQQFLDAEVLPKLNEEKHKLVFAHHVLWEPNLSDGSWKTWQHKRMTWGEIDQAILWADFVVVGDWNLEPITWRQHAYNLVRVGNRIDGDPVHWTEFIVSRDTVELEFHCFNIARPHSWYNRLDSGLRAIDE